MDQTRNYVMILSSGGIDSTACINFYKKIKFDIELLFFDYGQPAAIQEYKAIKTIAKYYTCNLNKVIVKNTNEINTGMILGRNAVFYFLGLLNFSKSHGTIASGIHFGTGYYDCSKEFINQIQLIFDNYSQGTIKLGTPFLNYNKKDLLDYCKLEKVPIELTYSCELGNKQPCGKCATCKDLEAIYARQN